MVKNIHDILRDKRSVKPYIGWETFAVRKDLSEEGVRKVFEELDKTRGSEYIIYEAMLCCCLSPAGLKVSIEYIDRIQGLTDDTKDRIYSILMAFALNAEGIKLADYLMVYEYMLGKEKYLKVMEIAAATRIQRETFSNIKAHEIFESSIVERSYLLQAIKLIPGLPERIKRLAHWNTFEYGSEVFGKPSQLLLEAIAESDKYGFLFVSYAIELNEKIQNKKFPFSSDAVQEICYFLEHIELEDYFGLISKLALKWSDIQDDISLLYGEHDQSTEQLLGKLNNDEFDAFDLRSHLSGVYFMRHHSGIELLFDRLEKQIDAKEHINDDHIRFFPKNDIISYINRMDQQGKRKPLIDKIEHLFNELEERIKAKRIDCESVFLTQESIVEENAEEFIFLDDVDSIDGK